MIPFLKMHGLGNDFVVLDRRDGAPRLDAELARQLADRRFGVGCDQVIVLEPPTRDDADVFMRIHNPDGGEAEACGNATRCIANLVMEETGAEIARIETVAGLLTGRRQDGGRVVSVDMGAPRLDWRDIPLAKAMDTLALPGSFAGYEKPCAVSMGNPHIVFFVPDAQAVALESVGPKIEHDPLFPARANIEFATIRADGSIDLRVWERGAGITLACGSGACATMVAAVRRGLTGRKAAIDLPGGRLEIEWREEDGHVIMTGPVALSFRGEFAAA